MHDYFPTNVPIAGLPPGTNVVAVGVRKFSPIQPGLSFDLELFGTREFAPRLAASHAGADFTARWPATNDAGFILLSGTNLSRPAAWSPLGGPYLLNGGFTGSSVLPHWAETRMKRFGSVSGLVPLRVTCTVWRLLVVAVTVWVAAASTLHALRSGEVSIR